MADPIHVSLRPPGENGHVILIGYSQMFPVPVEFSGSLRPEKCPTYSHYALSPLGTRHVGEGGQLRLIGFPSTPQIAPGVSLASHPALYGTV